MRLYLSPILGLAAVLAGVAEVEAAPAAPPRPNIVFILADDLGWRDVGCFGSTFHKTPNIDALARRGMLFTQAYAANPLCSPTRASLLTGQFPARLGITAPVCHLPEVKLTASVRPRGPADQRCLVAESATRLDTNYVTLAEVLKAAGYATGHFGKWHLGAEPYSPLQQGFDVDVPHHPGPGPAGSYVAPWRFAPALKFTGAPGEHIEDRMAQEAAKFIRAHKTRPFFLNYWAFSVHAPYDAKKSLVERYREAMDENVPQHNPLYAAMMHSLDDAVGTLVRTLEEEKLLDHTLIVFFSDNGGVNWQALKREGRGGPDDLSKPFADIPPTSNAPLRGGKASVYEGGVREPCFVVWPGVVRAGARSEAMIQSIDFLPTLAEVAGAPLPANQKLDGRSFLPILRGEAAAHRDTIFTFFPHNTPASSQLPACAVRRGDWKLIRYFHDGPKQEHRHELYNLRDDLGETEDQAAAQPTLVKELDALIEGFLKETGAVVPGPNPAYSGAAPKAAAAPDPLEGWKARRCEAIVKGGILTVTGTGPAPFLGFGVGRVPGPAVLRLRVRAAAGGDGQIEWLPSGVATQTNEMKSVPFDIKPGGWQEVSVDIPARGSLGIVRVYLPAQKQPVQIDWLELKTARNTRRWEFEGN
jgi:arylsulfatase A-like enzyme